jgi:hypothetical protein
MLADRLIRNQPEEFPTVAQRVIPKMSFDFTAFRSRRVREAAARCDAPRRRAKQ